MGRKFATAEISALLTRRYRDIDHKFMGRYSTFGVMVEINQKSCRYLPYYWAYCDGYITMHVHNVVQILLIQYLVLKRSIFHECDVVGRCCSEVNKTESVNGS